VSGAGVNSISHFHLHSVEVISLGVALRFWLPLFVSLQGGNLYE
jgi:hypothetical protein